MLFAPITLLAIVAGVSAQTTAHNDFSAYDEIVSKATRTPKFSTINPAATDIAKAAETAAVNSFKDKPLVKGKAFDKFYQVWLENTDKWKARDEPGLVELQKQGITLTNYWGLTHPSEPNYVGVVGGDYFGIFDDAFLRIPENVSTVVDLLDSKNISWAEYQEHQPHAGFEGFNYSRQSDYANDYVRKHNPLIIYDSVVSNPHNLGYIKNYTEFNKDLKNKDLPQWAFFTPNMTNDGHDTDISVSGRYVTNWVKPLLNNTEFAKDSLIIITFDENETYKDQNSVLAILLGGAVPDHLRGTTDDTFYDHYSNLATVEANWELPHLGRGDVNANVFKFVADELNIKNRNISTEGLYHNASQPGYFMDDTVPIPVPDLTAVGISGNKILPKIAEIWGKAAEKNSTVAYPNSTASATSGAGVAVAGVNHTSPSVVPSKNTNGATLITLSGAALVGAIGALLL
ncbi:phosphoesterase family-domain-containing protein [Yarrowia lipolytica]|jgi:acid phosphatase|uniref:acid phosphatase n=2 Tax=Yarrowia lipolytica TaxID=4952 RepID=Q6C3F9_YARLI|nr:YALI0E35222p [Yarrowia lipolytica CLIB122]QNQ00939.1 Putative acid phosphatase [Yarrowia lipolytica]RDW22595.1 phosphoesterase family-domain-containing protein [Yarrowia lipolytica]RDW36292.1 phosphoesterase family-domain-containing protein [Yarrowia lipolytica]RDW42955.1 phosphoesterase family-domain-containing protein [Yarrowia lipolytica]RDW49692.1 phosphoesterase family-domain-containing protein [Yarrowia lipolytica]|eukprot:XP_504803.1 YALI0E35222p [Yarrowia lipolytica CLIB122]